MSMSQSIVNRVLVLGGGSAGFLSAITLKARVPALEVTVLRSKDIGIIGVGEGTTTGVTRHLHGYLGLDPGAFHREADPIWKLGIRFLWGERPHFDYTFAQQLDTRHHKLPKATGFYAYDDMTDYGLQVAMMERNRAFVRDPNGLPLVEGSFAYHLENETFVGWLEKTAARLGVWITDGTVVEVKQNDAGVESLHLDDGRQLTADLFVDSSGFKSVLLRQALAEPFVDYSPSLWCDRAVVGGWDRGPDEPIQPYTVAETMDAGWAWRIDHRNRINRGYVYSSAFISDEAAEAEFRLKNPKIAGARIVRFRSGRHERSWVRNVVGVGNAYGFVEPLEATSLSMICQWARDLAELLHDGDRVVRPSQQSLFNVLHTRTFDGIRWFLGVHYKFNGRLQTPFWRECRERVDIAGAEPIVEYYRENGPTGFFRNVLLDPADPFGVEGYLTMFVGQRVPFLSTHVPTDEELRTWSEFRNTVRQTAERGVGVAEALVHLKSPQWKWQRKAFS